MTLLSTIICRNFTILNYLISMFQRFYTNLRFGVMITNVRDYCRKVEKVKAEKMPLLILWYFPDVTYDGNWRLTLQTKCLITKRVLLWKHIPNFENLFEKKCFRRFKSYLSKYYKDNRLMFNVSEKYPPPLENSSLPLGQTQFSGG